MSDLLAGIMAEVVDGKLSKGTVTRLEPGTTE